jgi:hypothetical protein
MQNTGEPSDSDLHPKSGETICQPTGQTYKVPESIILIMRGQELTAIGET